MSDWQARIVAWLATVPLLFVFGYLGAAIHPDLMVFPGVFVILVVGATTYVLLRQYCPEKPRPDDNARKDSQER